MSILCNSMKTVCECKTNYIMYLFQVSTSFQQIKNTIVSGKYIISADLEYNE